jgi:hypothetical protein
VLLSLANDSTAGVSEAHFKKLVAEKVLERLRGADAEVSGADVLNMACHAERHPEWAERVAAEADQLRAAIRAAHNVPLRFLIWAGNGGAIEDKAMYQAAGLLKRGPRLYLLDSADPLKLKSILEDIERRHSLPIGAVLRSTLAVGAGMSAASFEAALNLDKLANLFERCRVESAAHFLSMAPEGSPLDQLATRRGYRRVNLRLDGAGTAAGCQSGPLTRASLYPLALADVDLRAWIGGACLSDRDMRTAWRLAAFLHAQTGEGRDKVTLLLPKPWAGAAAWTQQAAAGEDGGALIVPCARPRLANYYSPKDARQDRVFLAIAPRGAPGPDRVKIALLRRAGYPLAVLTMPRAALSSYMQFVHCAAFGMAWLRGSALAAPTAAGVRESIAVKILAEAGTAGGTMSTSCWKRMALSQRQASFREALTLYYDRLPVPVESAGQDAPSLYAAILGKLAAERGADRGELVWFGDTRYSAVGMAMRRVLERAAEHLFERRLKMPACVHETATGLGRCFTTVLLSARQEQLAEARYAPDYHVAQFLAAQIALAERGCHVVAIVVKDMGEASRRTLEEFFHRAAAGLKAGRF